MGYVNMGFEVKVILDNRLVIGSIEPFTIKGDLFHMYVPNGSGNTIDLGKSTIEEAKTKLEKLLDND